MQVNPKENFRVMRSGDYDSTDCYHRGFGAKNDVNQWFKFVGFRIVMGCK